MVLFPAHGAHSGGGHSNSRAAGPILGAVSNAVKDASSGAFGSLLSNLFFFFTTIYIHTSIFLVTESLHHIID